LFFTNWLRRRREDRRREEERVRAGAKWPNIVHRVEAGETILCEVCGEPLRSAVEDGAEVVRCERKCTYIKYCT